MRATPGEQHWQRRRQRQPAERWQPHQEQNTRRSLSRQVPSCFRGWYPSGPCCVTSRVRSRRRGRDATCVQMGPAGTGGNSAVNGGGRAAAPPSQASQRQLQLHPAEGQAVKAARRQPLACHVITCCGTASPSSWVQPRPARCSLVREAGRLADGSIASASSLWRPGPASTRWSSVSWCSSAQCGAVRSAGACSPAAHPA